MRVPTRGGGTGTSRYLDRFELLLALTAAAIVTLSLVDFSPDDAGLAGRVDTAVVTVFVGATLLVAMRSSGVRRRLLRVADVLIGLTMLAAVLSVVVGAASSQWLLPSRVAPVGWLVLSLLAPLVIVRRVLTHRQVDVRTLLGALSAYLLIPVAYYFTFLAVDVLQGEFFEQEEPTASFMYFSLVTLTTLGYGDLAPVSPLGRLLATSEALIGQVFLVTFVALVVGLFGDRVRNRSSTRARPEG